MEKVNKENPKHYSVMNINTEERKKSSSGAIFPLLAKEVLNENGIVCGVAYDENMVVKHMFATTEEEMQRFRTSKYVYSNIGGVFIKIKEYISEGKKVLFVGTPCQVDALKRYIGKENSENLILCDIICHGTPKPVIFKLYVEYLEKKFNKKVININFRDKSQGWHKPQTVITFSDGSTAKDSIFFDAFDVNAIEREECYKCNYYKIDRVSDITIGDFWGVDKLLPEMEDNIGTSLVITSTTKGKEIFDKVKNEIKYSEICKEDAIKYNHNKPIQKHRNYDKIHKKINDKNFIKYLEKYIKEPFLIRTRKKIVKIIKIVIRYKKK